MKYLKTLILWILALQLLNMSICSEAYWFYYNDRSQLVQNDDIQADPTETIVELLVEMKQGQQDAFTYDQHNIDPKAALKITAWQIDLESEWASIIFLRKNSRIYFVDLNSSIQAAPEEILSPPPDRDINYSSNNI